MPDQLDVLKNFRYDSDSENDDDLRDLNKMSAVCDRWEFWWRYQSKW